MMKNRSMLLGLAALCCAAVLVALGEDKPGETRDKGSKDKGGAKASAFMGRVAKVDADKMTIELRDAKPWTAGGDRDKGARDSKDGAKDRGTGRDSDKPEAGRGGAMTFKVGERAKITLDGKEAKLADLKADAWARVHTSGAAGGADREKPADKPVADKPVAAEEGARTMTADRIEAFTKDPGAGGERDSGRKDSKERE